VSGLGLGSGREWGGAKSQHSEATRTREVMGKAWDLESCPSTLESPFILVSVPCHSPTCLSILPAITWLGVMGKSRKNLPT
jgi:hypothetical protein